MSNILNNISSNSDERTELIEYKRIYNVVKYLSPLLFIFLFLLIFNQIFNTSNLDINFKHDYLAERFTFYSMLFSFSGYCLSLYLFKVSNLLRYLFYSVIMYFISYAVGIFTAMLCTNVSVYSYNLNVISYLIVFIPLIIGVGFNLFTQMNGTYAFWNKYDLKNFLRKFSNFLISKELIDKNTNDRKTPRIYLIFSMVTSIFSILLALGIIFFDPSNTLGLGTNDIILSPIVMAILSANGVCLILFLVNKTERIALILSGMFIFSHFFNKYFRFVIGSVYGISAKTNIALELLALVVPVLALIISIKLIKRK